MRRRAAAAIALLALLAAGTWIWQEYVGWRVTAAVHALRRVPPARIGLCRCRPDSTIELRRDGLRLSADLYGIGAEPRPPVLLLHGLTPYGNDLPVYHVLASRLADAGYVVLAVDFAGYGDSDDPFESGSAEAFDSRRDVQAALAALDSLPAAAGPVMLVGHSMGAIEAMEVGVGDPRVGAVVVIGPPRRTADVLATPEGREYHWQRFVRTHDSVYHHPLANWFTREQFLDMKALRDIERFRDDWARDGHVPLVMIDGGRESSADREYLARYAARVHPPSRYVTIADADHYLNTGRIGRILYYDRAALGALVREISALPAAR